MSIGAFFTKKIGPLPVWGYGAIAAGGTFILLKGGGGGSKSKGKGKGNGSGPATNDPNGSDGSSGSFTGNTTETLSSDQTFGGGSLGFLARPFGNFSNVFVHLHPHPHGGFFSGGRNYSDHAFRSHGFGRSGRDRGGDDHRHGAFGGRNFRGSRNQGHGGTPRGHAQGHYSPRPGLGSHIAQALHPGNRRARTVAPSSTRPNSDARPRV